MMRSWLVFDGPIRHALHSLKYQRNLALGDALAHNMAVFVGSLAWQVDVVVPIPLGKDRMKERGYNQSGLVARPLALLNHWHYSPRALTRVRETRTQVGLTPVERKENVSGAFRAVPEMVVGRTVLLLDDVATTGATLAAGAASLIEAGAITVYALSLARALPHHGLTNV